MVLDVLRTMDMRIRFYEDTAGLFSMFLKAERVSYIPEVAYYYRQIETSTSHMRTFDVLQQMQYFGRFMTMRFQEADMPEKAYHVIDGQLLSSLLFYEGGGYFNDYSGIFPFVEEKPIGRIALYGYGSFGERFYQAHQGFPLLGRFDKNYKKYQKQGVDVHGPQDIHVKDGDVILVTIWKETTARKAAAELREMLSGFSQIYTISKKILHSAYAQKKLRDLRT